jgi:single-strand DNA-binding protein
MNKVILIGRLTRDPEMRYTQSAEPLAIARYSLAVDRRFAKRDDPNAQTADFINCTAFGKAAEFAERFLKKGMQIAVVGRITTSSWDDPQTGQKRYGTEVTVEEQEFTESKAAFEQRQRAQQTSEFGYDNQAYSGGGYAAPPPQQGGYGSPPPSNNYGGYNPQQPPTNYEPTRPAQPTANYSQPPEGFSAIAENVDDDDLPF